MESERIYLRPVGPEDAELLLSWGQDPYYQETAGFAHYRNLPEAEEGALAYQQRLASYMICLKKGQAIGLLEQGDKQAFIDSFRKVEHWFGDYAQRFQSESRTLLRQANDSRQ